MLFYKKNVFENVQSRTRALFFRKSYDGGDTWGEEKELLNFGFNTWIYNISPKVKDGIVHLAFSVKDSVSNLVKDVYYIKSGNSGESWENLQSVGVSGPGSLSGCKVYESEHGKETRVWDLAIDTSGNPVIAFVVYDSVYGVSYYAKVSYKQWESIEVGRTKNVYYPTGLTIDEKDPKIVYATQNNGGVSGIYEMHLDSGGNFQTKRRISNNERNNQVRPQMVRNYADMKLMWVEAEEYVNYQKFKSNIRGYIVEKKNDPR